MRYSEMDRDELLKERERLSGEYEAYRSRGLKLDLSRGKPAADPNAESSVTANARRRVAESTSPR